MRIVIVGDGKVGSTLAAELSREDHDIVMIDRDPDVLKELVDRTDVSAVVGNGATLQAQRDAGVGESELLIAATSSDEVNVLCCMLGRKLGVKHTIARVRSPEYSDLLVFLKEELRLSMTINPDRAAAMEILNLLRFPAAIKRETFAKGRVEIVELRLTEGNPLCGRALRDLPALSGGAKVLICGVERDGEVYIPTGAFQLRPGDAINATGAPRDLVGFVRRLGFAERKVRSVILVGGSRIAFYLARALQEDGPAVKIIEQNAARCEELAEALPHADIIHADGTQPEVLQSEGLEQTNALVTLTNIDEENMVIAMYAGMISAGKVVAKINRMEYEKIFRSMGIESVVSPKNLVCHDIVRYVRAMQNTSEDSVLTLHRIVNEKVDALEFAVTPDVRCTGVPLKSLRLRPDILVACINRQGRVIIPRGDDALLFGDTVVIVTKAEKMLTRLDDIFAEPPRVER